MKKGNDRMESENELLKKFIRLWIQTPDPDLNGNMPEPGTVWFKLAFEEWKRKQKKPYKYRRGYIRKLQKMNEKEAFILWEYIQCFMSLSNALGGKNE